jgi:ABC-type antimicrobial peptide transport system permease subunit
VVGVVEDASTGELEEPPAVSYYLPLAQTGFAAEGLYVRAAHNTRDVARAIAPILRSLSPDIRFARTRTLDDILAPQTRSWTLGASLFSAFGLLALLVAAVGLYSLLAFDVAQRTRDIGIRSALGANTVRMLRDVVGQGAGLALAGALLGLSLCLAAGPFVQPLLFQVNSRDPAVLLAVGAVIIAVAGLASLPPALRATRVDPMEALRAD